MFRVTYIKDGLRHLEEVNGLYKDWFLRTIESGGGVIHSVIPFKG